MRGWFYKCVHLIRLGWSTAIFVLGKPAGWHFGRGLVVEGPVIVRSAKGQVTIGTNTLLGPYVNIAATLDARLVIGSRVSINQGCYLIARRLIEIGDGTRIGEYSSIRDNTHVFDSVDQSVSDQGYETQDVRIGTNVWIGRNVTIMPGVTIGTGAIVGAGAVVTSDVPAYAVAVGMPARVVRVRQATGS